MARIADIHDRLRNWAIWKIRNTSGGLSYASARLQDRVDQSADHGTFVPVNDLDAEKTDQAVQALEPDLRRTVTVVYLGAGGMKDHANKLCVTVAAVEQRIWRAHHVLVNWFTEQAEIARLRREQNEAIQSSARPT